MATYVEEKWFDLEEAALHSKYGKKTVQRWTEDRRDPLPCLKDGRGGKIVIARSELDAYMHRRAHDNVARMRVHFVTSMGAATPAACGRMRDGITVSAQPDEVTCEHCLQIITDPIVNGRS